MQQQLNFMNENIEIRQCDLCQKDYCSGALDFFEEEFICPTCSDRKENDESNIRHRD